MKADGGPAFPNVSGHDGMSLRDWFAGMALSRIAGSNFDHTTKALPKLNDISEECYAYADAMLAERSKT